MNKATGYVIDAGYLRGDATSLTFTLGIIVEGIMVSEVGVAGSGKIHTKSLSRVGLLEASLEVVERRHSVGARGFFREIEGTLRIIVVLGARTDDICI